MPGRRRQRGEADRSGRRGARTGSACPSPSARPPRPAGCRRSSRRRPRLRRRRARRGRAPASSRSISHSSMIVRPSVPATAPSILRGDDHRHRAVDVDGVGSGYEQDLGRRCRAALRKLVESGERASGQLQLVVRASLPDGDRPMRSDGSEDDPAHYRQATPCGQIDTENGTTLFCETRLDEARAAGRLRARRRFSAHRRGRRPRLPRRGVVLGTRPGSRGRGGARRNGDARYRPVPRGRADRLRASGLGRPHVRVPR